MTTPRDRASDKPAKRRPRKPQPSFDAPPPAADAAPGWVYRSDGGAPEPPAPLPAPIARSPVPAAARPPAPVAPVQGSGTFERRADAVTLPFALLLTTILAPVGWLFGRRGPR